MWGFLVALISGALMSIQGVFNTEMTKQTSLWVSTGWVQFSAFLVCVLAWIFTGRDSVGALWQVENKYTLLGGIIGAFIVISSELKEIMAIADRIVVLSNGKKTGELTGDEITEDTLVRTSYAGLGTGRNA